MKTFELIRIRTGEGNGQTTSEILQQIAAEAGRSAPQVSVQLYRENSITGDFAFILQWNGKTVGAEGSPLGQTIRRSIETLGIVDYTAWTLI
jgi:hypothetical protein